MQIFRSIVEGSSSDISLAPHQRFAGNPEIMCFEFAGNRVIVLYKFAGNPEIMCFEFAGEIKVTKKGTSKRCLFLSNSRDAYCTL